MRWYILPLTIEKAFTRLCRCQSHYYSHTIIKSQVLPVLSDLKITFECFSAVIRIGCFVELHVWSIMIVTQSLGYSSLPFILRRNRFVLANRIRSCVFVSYSVC